MTFTAPPQVDVDFEGTTYTIKSQQASDDLEFNSEIIKAEPWYNSQETAEYFINEIRYELGDYRGNTILDPQSHHLTPIILWELPKDSSVYSSYSTYGDIDSGITNGGITAGKGGAIPLDTTTYTKHFGLGLLGVNSNHFLTSSPTISSVLSAEWVQPYAAMQNVGLRSMDNNRDLVLAKAGECNNYGWVIGDTDYCVYTNAKNKVSYVNGDTTRGSYGSAVFN